MYDKHLSSQFDSELNSVSSNVLELGGLVEMQIRQAIYALSEFSVEVADQVEKEEARVNALELEIDRALSNIIARRQPTAIDLRLLLDEPTSALDPISTAKVEELVDELKKDYTIAIVTHNMQQAARISDFTAYMYLGELIEFGSTNELFLKPRKKATEDYITGRFG